MQWMAVCSLNFQQNVSKFEFLTAFNLFTGGPTAQIIERKGWKCDKDFVGHRKAVNCVVNFTFIIQSKQTKRFWYFEMENSNFQMRISLLAFQSDNFTTQRFIKEEAVLLLSHWLTWSFRIGLVYTLLKAIGCCARLIHGQCFGLIVEPDKRPNRVASVQYWWNDCRITNVRRWTWNITIGRRKGFCHYFTLTEISVEGKKIQNSFHFLSDYRIWYSSESMERTLISIWANLV